MECSCEVKCCQEDSSGVGELFLNVIEVPPTTGRKVTIVGCGQVGMACAFGLLCKGVCREICIVDVVKDKLKGESIDLQQASLVLDDPCITASTDYSVSANSRVCIVTAGVRQTEGESRLSLVQRNCEVMKSIIPQLVKHSPQTILLIVCNPVDVMTYVAWKLSGLPRSHVIGSGTSLDTARFRHFIAERLNCATNSCHGWIIGEHGDSSVAVWSSVNVGGVAFQQLNPNIGTEQDKEQWGDLHKRVVNAAYEVIKLKGYTNWAIGSCVTTLTAAILDNTRRIIPVSTSAKGIHNIQKDVFLSLPCVLSSNGVAAVLNQNLTPTEKEQLKKSVDALAETQAGLRI